MTSSRLRLARLPVLLTVAAVVGFFVAEGRRELILHVYVLAIATFALLQLVLAVHRSNPPAGPSRFDAALRRRPARALRLPELEQAEREVALGMATAFDLHYRLRPPLRRTAGELLAARRGIDLDAEPEAARRALGETTWELVRADREAPTDRFAPGLRLDGVRTVVTALESL